MTEFANAAALDSSGRSYGLVRFTPNAWTHKSVDARAELRTFLSEARIHNYDEQVVGEAHIVRRPVEVLLPDAPAVISTMNMGRTPKPDRRFWIPALPLIYTANELLAVVATTGTPIVVNMSRMPLQNIPRYARLLEARALHALEDDLLLAIARAEADRGVTVDELAMPHVSSAAVSSLLAELEAAEFVAQHEGEYGLTADGASEVLRIAVGEAEDGEPSDILTGSAVERVGLERRTTLVSVVSPQTARLMRQVESGLVDRLEVRLRELGHETGRYRIGASGSAGSLLTDLVDFTSNVLFEAKARSNRDSVRMAIGQLFDYARFIDPPPKLAILLPDLPAVDMMALLSDLNICIVVKNQIDSYLP